MLDESLEDVREYSILGDKEWNEFKENVRGKATSKIYWLLFSFWMVYSFYHIFFTKATWWSQDYNSQLTMDIYGFLVQGLNGCFFGGIFMTLISVSLNLAYREIYSRKVFSDDIITTKGKKKLSKFKNLILTETFAAAIIGALAISIWSKAILYAPIIGSMVMILPTAIYPHYTFYKVLSKAKEGRISVIEKHIEKIPNDERATVGDLILLNKLSIELRKVKDTKPWLVDLKAILKLIGAAITSQMIALIIKYITV